MVAYGSFVFSYPVPWSATKKEPWDYNIDFENYFRSAIELKYQLMPYVYAQSYISSQHGWPFYDLCF